MQSASGKSGPASADARELCEFALQADERFGCPGTGPCSSSMYQTLTPGAGSGSSSEAGAPTDGAGSGTSAPRRRALAGKVKVAGAWVNAAEFSKPAAFRPTSQTTNTPKKKGGGNRPSRVKMILSKL